MGRQAAGWGRAQGIQQRQGCHLGTTAVCARLGLRSADGRRVMWQGQHWGPDAQVWTRPALRIGVTAAQHPQAPGTEGCGADLQEGLARCLFGGSEGFPVLVARGQWVSLTVSCGLGSFP